MLNITTDIPLYYIIRPDVAPISQSEEKQSMFYAPLVGTMYKLDNKKVNHILTELSTATDASQWIKDHKRNQDGKGAWKKLANTQDFFHSECLHDV